MSLAEKIVADRKITVEYKGMTIYARRPTYEEYGQAYSDKATDPEICRRFIIGWDNVKEKDVIVDGDDKIIPFNKVEFGVLSGDLPELCSFVAAMILDATVKYRERVEAQAKN